MPAKRRSRSRSAFTAPQRPESSNSTASGRSGRIHEAGAPYPHSRPAAQGNVSQAMESQIMTNADMNRLLHEVVKMQPDLRQDFQQVHHDSQSGYHIGDQAMDYGAQSMDFTFDQIAPDAVASVTLSGTEPRRSRGSTNQTNENELKDMLEKNLARSLEEVAAEVTQNERTSSAEKTKQLFAMLWLKRNLVVSTIKESVPRTRVHTSYAARCAKFHLQPLNPASFGKLVRVIYPDIQTRRLGVRTKSKYHYVDLTLLDDVEARVGGDASRDISMMRHALRTTSLPIDMPRFQPDTSIIPSEEQSTASPVISSRSSADPDIRIFPVPRETVLAPARPTTKTSYFQRMKFAPYHIMEANDREDIELPDISPYVPPKTDSDAANALATLYLTHVTSLVDCVRFCKEKMFFRLFTAFQGTLTVPVQKLLVHTNLAPWIKECDYLMYQKMIKVIAPLTLQVMPPVVMKFLDAVSKLLDDHISRTFEGLPQHVLDAKLESATIFGQLLQRMLRANQSAHAAGAILIDDENRNRMWIEWVKFVQPKCMMNAILPDCGYDQDIYKLLTHDIRALLLPLNTDPNLERNTHYEMAAIAQNSMPQPQAFELDRIGNFLESLKARFPKVPSRDLLHYIHGITGHGLRDITMDNGESYNCWLITKCFIDELTLWLVHAGGFLGRRVPAIPSKAYPFHNGATRFLNHTNGGSVGGDGSASHTRYSSLGSEFEASGGNASDFQSNSMRIGQNHQAHMMIHSQPTTSYHATTMEGFSQTFATATPNDSRPSTSDVQNTDIDDSGIGLSLLDDDFDMKRSTGHQQHTTSFMQPAGYHNATATDSMSH